jgi:stearoyl-CoA desaturase (delta-9 desaturase)
MTEDPLPTHEDPTWYKAVVVAVVAVPFLATLGGLVALWGQGAGWLEVGLLVGMWGAIGMGISVGYHRMLTHGAFKAHPAVRAIALGLGAMAVQDKPSDWAATHKRHHAHADEDGDPHSPLEGFWHAHFGWLVRDRFVRSGPVYEELRSDPVVRAVDRRYPWLVLAGFAIPTAIGGLVTLSWTGALSGLLWGGVIRVFLGHHVTWSVNSLSHLFGGRPYDTDDQARNNPVVAVLGFGEGWHNNHHAFPRAAFLGHTWYQFDPGRWAIKGLEKLGLVWDVWMPDEETRRERRTTG